MGLVQEKGFSISRKIKFSAVVLICANIVSVFGVLFWNWNVFTLLLAYWFESAIIGVFTILKIIFAKGDILEFRKKESNLLSFIFRKFSNINVTFPDLSNTKSQLDYKNNKIALIIIKITSISFFCAHYSGFMIGHLIFIILLTNFAGINSISLQYLFSQLTTSLILALALFISHGYSFLTNYLGNYEYKKINIGNLMIEPYGRIFVMQVSIILGVFIAVASKLIFIKITSGTYSGDLVTLGLGVGPALVLIFIKTVLDIRAHVREHKKLSSPISTETSRTSS